MLLNWKYYISYIYLTQVVFKGHFDSQTNFDSTEQSQLKKYKFDVSKFIDV